MTKFSIQELNARLSSFRVRLRRHDFDGAVLFQRADLLYFLDTILMGALVVPADKPPKLYVWRGIDRLPSNFPHDAVPIRNAGKLPEAVAEAGFTAWSKVGVEEDVLPVQLLKKVVQPAWPRAEITDVSPLLREQRSVKSPAERERIRECGAVLASGFKALLGAIREGVTEREAYDKMYLEMRARGADALVRVRGFNAEVGGILACAETVADPTAFDGPVGQRGVSHYSTVDASAEPIQSAKPILADVVVATNGYITDMSRTYCIGGMDARFKEAHAFAVDLHERLLKRIKPGALPGDVFRWAVGESERAGLGDVFMNRGRDKVRFIGHGVGLELDESPVIHKRNDTPFMEGNVVALEPKIIFDDGGVGIEDTVIVTTDGCEVATPMDRSVFVL